MDKNKVTSAIFCNHANEMPNNASGVNCKCPDNCYCRHEGACKADILDAIDLFCNARGQALELEARHSNRPNARKSKVGGSCAMCKPHKHKWSHKFKATERNKKKELK